MHLSSSWVFLQGNRMVLKVEGKLAGADGRDEILQEGTKKGEGDTINSDEKDDDEQQRRNNNNNKVLE